MQLESLIFLACYITGGQEEDGLGVGIPQACLSSSPGDLHLPRKKKFLVHFKLFRAWLKNSGPTTLFIQLLLFTVNFEALWIMFVFSRPTVHFFWADRRPHCPWLNYRVSLFIVTNSIHRCYNKLWQPLSIVGKLKLQGQDKKHYQQEGIWQNYMNRSA